MSGLRDRIASAIRRCAADRVLLLHVAEQFDSLSRLVCDLVERRMPGNAPQQPQNRPCEASSPRPDHRDTPSHSGPQNAETDL